MKFSEDVQLGSAVPFDNDWGENHELKTAAISLIHRVQNNLRRRASLEDLLQADALWTEPLHREILETVISWRDRQGSTMLLTTQVETFERLAQQQAIQ
jgi:hypothetical protein